MRFIDEGERWKGRSGAEGKALSPPEQIPGSEGSLGNCFSSLRNGKRGGPARGGNEPAQAGTQLIRLMNGKYKPQDQMV